MIKLPETTYCISNCHVENNAVKHTKATGDMVGAIAKALVANANALAVNAEAISKLAGQLTPESLEVTFSGHGIFLKDGAATNS